MNSNELFEEYTKASYKMKWIKEKADELGVYGSDIIAELLKTGFKFEEIKRGNPGQYKAGMKKYEAWKKAGSPSDDDPDVMEQYKKQKAEKAESTQVEGTAEPAEELVENPAEETVQPIEQPIEQPMKEEISELKRRAEKAEKTLIEKVQEFQSAERGYKGEISRLEKEMCELTQNYNETMQINAAVEKQNNECEQYRAKYYELLKKHEELEKYYAVVSGDLESERELLVQMDKEMKEKDHKLELAERFILNSIYQKMDEEPKEGKENA